jgi:hypothetical protein
MDNFLVDLVILFETEYPEEFRDVKEWSGRWIGRIGALCVAYAGLVKADFLATFMFFLTLLAGVVSMTLYARESTFLMKMWDKNEEGKAVSGGEENANGEEEDDLEKEAAWAVAQNGSHRVMVGLAMSLSRS